MAERLENSYNLTANGSTTTDGSEAKVAQLGLHRILIAGTFGGGSLTANPFSSTTGNTNIDLPDFPITAPAVIYTSDPYYRFVLSGATAPDIDIVVTPIITRDRGV